jgi:altronate dehydratase
MTAKEKFTKPRAIVLDTSDTVGVILDDVKNGESVHIIGMNNDTITAIDVIEFGHKIALYDHRKGDVVKKYGEIIGSATVDIPKGSWIHLHNLISNLDHYLNKRIHIGRGETE